MCRLGLELGALQFPRDFVRHHFIHVRSKECRDYRTAAKRDGGEIHHRKRFAVRAGKRLTRSRYDIGVDARHC